MRDDGVTFRRESGGEIRGLSSGTRTALRALGVVSFTTLTALGARLTIRIGPVPFTLQVFFVLLAGMVLGSRLGAMSQAAYLALGLAGAPVFAAPPFAGPGYLLGPTGGYLLGFIAGAYVTGLVIEKWGLQVRGALTVMKYTLAGALGLLTVYSIGAPWLMAWYTSGGKNLSSASAAAWRTGIAPFAPVDILKSAAAAFVASGSRMLFKAASF